MMTFEQYAETRLGLEARLRETYEEEMEESVVLELERKQLMNALAENFGKFKALHEKKEELRRGLRNNIDRLETEYKGKELSHD